METMKSPEIGGWHSEPVVSERIDPQTGDYVCELRFHRASTAHSAPSGHAQVLTILQAATELSVSRATFSKLLGTEIPRTMVAGSVRVMRRDIEAYLERQREEVLPRRLRRSA
jgi:AraC-like DNA-binding protein